MEDKMFYDAHIHNLCKESGGFIIGLMGKPYFEGTLDNDSVLKLHNPEKNYFAFYYVTHGEINKTIKHKYIKIHPRREKYSPDEVINFISKNNPKCVMIDTLNEPYWQSNDYWRVAMSAPDITFIFPHSGGYLVNDFIKICHFQKNVWIDFALTHTNLGRLGDKKTGLNYINDAIKYALNSPFKNRVLLSSDYPFFSQADVVKYYKKMKKIDLLNNNFLELTKAIR